MNAYIHIPFCASICHYCDFTSFAGQGPKIPAYVNALCREIERSDLKGPLSTVYFGGGTPSTLSADQLTKILGALQDKTGFGPTIEISLEANPETVDLEKLKGYRKAGVNRVSFGAQAVQKEVLHQLGRGHEWPQVETAFQKAREAGFDNLNLDLMFGLPGQKLEMFEESLERSLALAPEHLSLYALQVEEGTPLAKKVIRGMVVGTEDETADQYELAQKKLGNAGYVQYEVSNFSKPDRECRHNHNIWKGEDYWGFGVSAVGTVSGVRTSHGEDLAEYIRTSGGTLQTEKLEESTKAFENLMLGLRTKEGVLKADVEKYAVLSGARYQGKFDDLLQKGFLQQTRDKYQVTSKGYFVLNGILEALMV